MQWKYGTELLEINYLISFQMGPESGHMDGAILLVEITKPNRNTDNVKVAIENANLCGKNMR